MKTTASIVAPLLFIASLAACGGGEGTAPAGSSAPAAAKSGAPAAKTTAAATAAATAAPTAEPAKASAAAFPAQALPAPFAALTIGAPAGSKLVPGVTGDYATIEGPDYVYKIEETKENETAKLKDLLGKAGAKITVDQPDGLIADIPGKDGASEWTVVRHLKVGDKQYQCSTTSKGAPKSGDKAQEAFDACGTLKAK